MASNASESSTSSWVAVESADKILFESYVRKNLHPCRNQTSLCYTATRKDQKGSSYHQPKQCMPRNDSLQQLLVPLLQSLSLFCFRDTKRPRGLASRRFTSDMISEKVCGLNTSQRFDLPLLKATWPRKNGDWKTMENCLFSWDGGLGGVNA